MKPFRKNEGDFAFFVRS